MSNLVEYSVRDGVAEIVMNRQPVNAINMELARGVIDAYHRARQDVSVADAWARARTSEAGTASSG